VFQALAPGVIDVRGVQVSLDHVRHRYLVAGAYTRSLQSSN